MEKILLLSHASAGLITLITGIAAMISPKRLKIHKPAGKIFYYAMWYVVISAFALSYLKTNIFLFLVGTLTFYTNVTGYRALKYYKSQVKNTQWVDWVYWMLTLILISATQSWLLYSYGFRFDGAFIVIHIFTIILFGNLIQDYFRLKNIPEKKEYLLAHIGKMGGTFIAAITAALVQNVHTDPMWIAWLLPTVLITPFLIYFSRSVRSGSFWRRSSKKAV